MRHMRRPDLQRIIHPSPFCIITQPFTVSRRGEGWVDLGPSPSCVLQWLLREKKTTVCV